MNVEYHPAAACDLNHAVNRYNNERAGLGDAPRAAVYATIDRVLENPEIYAENGGVRRALVTRFPYSVVYKRMAADRIRILVIRHHRRHPEHGSKRR